MISAVLGRFRLGSPLTQAKLCNTPASSLIMDGPIAMAQAAVAKQGDTVRSLKAQLKEGKVEKVSREFLPGVSCRGFSTVGGTAAATSCNTSLRNEGWRQHTREEHMLRPMQMSALPAHAGRSGCSHQAAAAGQDRPGHSHKGAMFAMHSV